MTSTTTTASQKAKQLQCFFVCFSIIWRFFKPKTKKKSQAGEKKTPIGKKLFYNYNEVEKHAQNFSTVSMLFSCC